MILNFKRSVRLIEERGMTTARKNELARAYEIDQSIIATAMALGLFKGHGNV